MVAGLEDIAPLAAGRQIAELVPGAILHDVPGAGHVPPLEAPDMFNGLLRSFLAGQTGNGRRRRVPTGTPANGR